MALFVPNPDAESVEEIIEQLSLELARAYRDIEDTLIREIAARAVRELALANELPTAPASGGLTVAERRRQNRILAELAAHRARAARELQAIAVAMVERVRVSGMAERIIDIAAREGEAAAAAQLGFAARQAASAARIPFIGGAASVTTTTLTGTAAQAVALVALSLQSNLDALNQRITRYPQDAYQRIVALHSPATLLGATTSRQQQAAAVQSFLSEGITGFVDRSGRNWTVGAYAEMAGRTSVNRAYTDAGVWRMQQSGLNLVTVVRGLDSCQKCAAWSGKILSTDGTPAGDYTLSHATEDGKVAVHVDGTVDQARNGGLFHPNCRCRLVPYFPGLTIPQGDTTYDPEAEKERAEQRRLEREIRAAKRREASAMTDTDRKRAAREVREAQAEMRGFIGRTGRLRQSYREQLHFADGRGGPRPTVPPARTPKGPRSGVDIRVAKTTDLGKDIRATRSAIATVHTIPSTAPNVEVLRESNQASHMGVYKPMLGQIKVRGTGPTVRLTTAHEIGHYLDFRVLGARSTGYETAQLSDDATKAWLTAVRSSAAVKELEALRGLDAKIDVHLSYLLSAEELWGRSYAQWIAIRSGDARMLEDVAHWRASETPWTRNRQWGTTDFEAIATAIDAIFKRKGLLK